MALGMVQVGYGKSLYMYPAHGKTEVGSTYEEFLAELATELELALEGSNGDAVQEENTEESEQEETPPKEKKEWEELLEQSDAITAVLQELLDEESRQQEEDAKEQQQKEEKGFEAVNAGEDELMLVSEYTRCSCKEEESGETVHYFIWYTKKGIFCKRTEKETSGKAKWKKKNDGIEWFLPFLSLEEFEKAITFLKQFPEDMSRNFAVNELFWLDFLDNSFDFREVPALLEGKGSGQAADTAYLGNSEFLQKNIGEMAEYWNRAFYGGRKKEYLHSCIHSGVIDTFLRWLSSYLLCKVFHTNWF